MNSVEFTYLRNADNHPIGAVAVEVIDAQTVKVGVSKCHPNDKFVKAVARNRACGRLNSSTEGMTLHATSDSWESSIIEMAAQYHLQNHQISDCAKFIRGRITRATSED
jgi:hypothetical protein